MKELPEYSADMCPRTRDLIFRMGMVSIKPTMTPEYASWRAKQLTDGLAKALA